MLVGGKSANLARMTRAGFPVPAGFTVSTHAYAEHVAAIQGEIAQHVAATDFGDPEGVESSAWVIRALIAGAAMPPAVAEELERAYARLGSDVYVAVRSSGTAEDLAEASFAGLHDTLLDVRGGDGP